MEERRKELRRQADRAIQKRMEELEIWRGDVPQSELRQRRRHAIRHNCTIQISLKVRHAPKGDTWVSEDHPIKGKVLDLSVEGSAVFLTQPLDIGQRVSVLITMRSGSKVHARGVVRWARAVTKRQGYACGVQFEQLEFKDFQLIQVFLKELEETIGL